MGQSKNRGSYKERKEQAIKRNEESRIARIQARAIAEANMSPAERAKQKQARMLLNLCVNLAHLR